MVENSITRSDIFHPVDIVEDVAIAYGYNNLERRLPSNQTIGIEFNLNALSDKVRNCVALAGFTEVLNWVLLSKDENYKMMRIKNKNQHVELSNPKTKDFEICRTNLLPGVLKILRSNIGRTELPLKLFEVGDVIHLDNDTNIGSANERRLCALICSTKNSGLEIIHGLLDRIMTQNECKFISLKELKDKYNGKWPNEDKNGKFKVSRYYCLEPSNKPTYFPKRQAQIMMSSRVNNIYYISNNICIFNG